MFVDDTPVVGVEIAVPADKVHVKGEERPPKVLSKSLPKQHNHHPLVNRD